MNFTEEDFENLETLFGEYGLKILSYEENRPKPFHTSQGPYALMTMVNKLSKVASDLQKRDDSNRVWNFFDKKIMKNITALMEQYVETRLLKKVEEENEEAKKYEGHILAVDGTHGSDKEPNFFLIDPDGKKSNMLAAKYIALMGIESPIAVAREITPVYLPRDPLGIIKVRDPEDDNKIIEALNTYIPPTWMKYLDDEDIPAELPIEVETMINHIFPVEMDRIYFWHWIYLSLTSRTSQFLVLCGDPGNGKNRIKILARALHGHRNSDDGKEKMFSSQFNTKLQNNTLIFCDEASYTATDVARMKEIPNGSVAIEGKHKDATRSTKIYCNVILANNYKTDNCIDFIDRKFCALTMSDKRLDVAIGEEYVDTITRKMEDINHPDYDEKYIAQIAKWVFKNAHHPEMFPRDEHKGSLFWDLAHTNMSEWQRNLVTQLNQINEGGPEVLKDLKELNIHRGHLKKGQLRMSTVRGILLKSKTLKLPGSKFPRLQLCLEFLKKYRDENGDKIFEMKKTGNSVTGDFFILDLRMGGEMEEIEPVNEVVDL